MRATLKGALGEEHGRHPLDEIDFESLRVGLRRERRGVEFLEGFVRFDDAVGVDDQCLHVSSVYQVFRKSLNSSNFRFWHELPVRCIAAIPSGF
jgi:hypothetical protein